MGALDKARDTLCEALGGARIDVQAPPRLAGRRERVVLCSDLHAPFVRMDIVAKVLALDVDHAILVGDIDDGYAASRYSKRQDVPLVESWANTKAILESFSRRFPRVSVVSGNHDERLEKTIVAAFPERPGIVSAIEHLAGGSLSPLLALTRDLKNVQVVGSKVGQFNIGWYWQYGDLVVAHAERFSPTPGSAVRAVGDWFRRMQKQLGLAPWRVLALAHTHQLSFLPYESDTLLLECGCLAQTQGYQLDAKVSGLPQRIGYVTLTMHENKVDVTSVHPVWLE